MKVLVCGGRDFSDSKRLAAALDALHSETEITLIIQGGQRDGEKGFWIGADWLASEWARWREVPFVNEPAKWKSQGRPAGPIRNKLMLDKWSPDVVVHFPGGTGTSGMVKLADGAGIRTIAA